ncbi:MAG: hypothetical protein HY699_24300 [Deltaproteobacteria bacterium]|nr:hypothetical protein [Deltaproteobacteria bacterium]
MPLPFGPHITFFGVVNANNRVVTPSATDAHGTPIYVRVSGSGFMLVVEGQPGTSRARVGKRMVLSDPNDPTVRPDLQMIVSRPLGNGSPAICDKGPAPAPMGGVPASGLDFGPSQAVADAINDLTCRFDSHESAGDACTLGPLGVPAFAGTGTQQQFCTAPVVGYEFAFPLGDTTVSVQLRDASGNYGDRRSLIVRVQ